MTDVNNPWVIIFSIALLIMLMSTFIIFFFVRYRSRQEEFEKEKQQLQFEQESELMKVQLELSEELMKKISVEIHDNVGQSLSLAKLQLHGLKQSSPNTHIEHTTELITRALQDLRNLSKSLNGNFLMELGLDSAIQREADLVTASGQIVCEYKNRPENEMLNEQQEVILFRCIQEALHNSVKHSGAKKIEIDVRNDKENLFVTVKDDGIGMDIHSVTPGIGHTSLQQRARIMGGICKLISAPGQGTEVRLEVPLKKNVLISH